MSDADLGENCEYADDEAYIEARFASGKLNDLAISTSENTLIEGPNLALSWRKIVIAPIDPPRSVIVC